MPRGFSAFFLITLIVGYSYEIQDHAVIVIGKQSLRENHKMKGKIVGGSPVPLESFPSMVQLYNLGNMCAGNILNSWTVLTSAHCFDFNIAVDDVVVQVGSRFVYDFNADTYGAASIVLHNEYNQSRNFACDIALVFLERAVQFYKSSS